MQKNRLMSTKELTRISGLIAISVVLKTYLSVTTMDWRFSLFGIPLVIIGLLYRPVTAAIAGFIVDLLYVLLSGYSLGLNLMTFEAVSFALVPALIVLFVGRENMTDKKIVLSIGIAFICGFMFNTAQLWIWSKFNTQYILAFLPIRGTFTVANIVINAILAPVIYKRVILPELKIFGR